MSQELTHETARQGDLVVHDNGSIFWKSVHHLSWIGDDGQRQTAGNASALLTEQEQQNLAELAAKFDRKEIG